ncbi:hypothetical protein QF035_002681 [Streptomyces umbrinus]|uniref:Uncharacterized protein n=1 Tax=Streptomyces umbrinus TaxID=67370 RepID=A0ABU0SNF6_9ACTN|nr:hypothetical protein [Streptomyces umbrinus]MDQ1025099.1 hypothetical protein [Streptomyces umbrinus]
MPSRAAARPTESAGIRFVLFSYEPFWWSSGSMSSPDHSAARAKDSRTAGSVS